MGIIKILSMSLIMIFFINVGGLMAQTTLSTTPGIYEKTLTLKNGQQLRYTLSLPDNFNTKKKSPLILALHFGGRVTPWYSKTFLEVLPEPALKELNAVMISPDCPGRGWQDSESESAVLELMNYIQKNYQIDNKKIVVTGFSMGGIGTLYMIAKHHDLFSAAIPIAALIGDEVLQLISKKIPIYLIQSSGDEIFPIKEVKEMVKKLKVQDVPIKLKIVDGIRHYHTYKFQPALQETVQWVKKIWEVKE